MANLARKRQQREQQQNKQQEVGSKLSQPINIPVDDNEEDCVENGVVILRDLKVHFYLEMDLPFVCLFDSLIISVYLCRSESLRREHLNLRLWTRSLWLLIQLIWQLMMMKHRGPVLALPNRPIA